MFIIKSNIFTTISSVFVHGPVPKPSHFKKTALDPQKSACRNITILTTYNITLPTLCSSQAPEGLALWCMVRTFLPYTQLSRKELASLKCLVYLPEDV